jgi:hypothetical protein
VLIKATLSDGTEAVLDVDGIRLANGDRVEPQEIFVTFRELSELKKLAETLLGWKI